MGSIKQTILEHEGYLIEAEEWVHEKVANGELEKIAAKLIRLQRKSYELKSYSDDTLQALCMVAHVVKTFGFNNPEVQATRLDPDNIGDATRILDEAFSILESPVLGRRVSHLVESTLRGKRDVLRDELEKKFSQEDE